MNKVIIFFLLLCLLGWSGQVNERGDVLILNQGDYELQMISAVALNEIRPDVDVIETRWKLVEKASGNELNVPLRVELIAPSKGMVFSTDFPVVEGTVLFHTVFRGRETIPGFSYLYPIRGEYTLKVKAELEPGKWIDFRGSFELRENREEIFRFSLLVLILALFGGVSGFVLARGQLAKEILSEV